MPYSHFNSFSAAGLSEPPEVPSRKDLKDLRLKRPPRFSCFPTFLAPAAGVLTLDGASELLLEGRAVCCGGDICGWQRRRRTASWWEFLCRKRRWKYSRAKERTEKFSWNTDCVCRFSGGVSEQPMLVGGLSEPARFPGTNLQTLSTKIGEYGVIYG